MSGLSHFISLALMLALTACEKAASPVVHETPVKTVAAGAVTSSALVRIAEDCSLSRPTDYMDFDPLSQERSRAPRNPNVIAWDSGAWGAIEASWRISRDGNGCFFDNERTLPGDGRRTKVYKFAVSNAEFDDIAATLNYVRLNAMMTNCKNFMSDAVNGSFTWYDPDRVSWVHYNKGDKCSGSDAFYQIMDTVTAQVKAKAVR